MNIIEDINVEDAYEYLLKRIVSNKEVHPRKGIEYILDEVLKGRSVLLSAPPGYGKTFISYCGGLYSAIASGPWSPRTIHVLPLRSIIEDCYGRLFEKGKAKVPLLGEGTVARQMMGTKGSPWLQRILIFTTLDTYTMCAMRIPPVELQKVIRGRSAGHGYLSKAAILASTTIFDEVHLFLEEGGKMASAFSSLLWWHKVSTTPVVVMSATLPSMIQKFLEELLQDPIILRYGKDTYRFHGREEIFRDKNFEEIKLKTIKNLKTNKPIKGKIHDIIKEAVERSGYKRILIVTNTVNRCIEVARGLKDHDLKPIILHGKILSKDRAERLQQLKEDEWISVSTQVVVAVVDISALCLITDSAPPCSLVQRTGRVLRSKEDADENGEILLIVDEEEIENENPSYHGIYDKELVRSSVQYLMEKTNVSWHLPHDIDNFYGYEEFIEECYSNANFDINNKIEPYLINSMKEFLLSPMRRIDKIKEFLIALDGSFVRDEPMILGVLNKMGLTLGESISINDREFAEMVQNYSLPLSFLDIIRLKDNLVGIYSDDFSMNCKIEKIECRWKQDLIREIIGGRLTAILIPEKCYDKEEGLRLYGES